MMLEGVITALEVITSLGVKGVRGVKADSLLCRLLPVSATGVSALTSLSPNAVITPLTPQIFTP